MPSDHSAWIMTACHHSADPPLATWEIHWFLGRRGQEYVRGETVLVVTVCMN
ncbi:MAG TPA: hypothetical protein VKW06_10320 [Candidatus Angelobacter sp.]|nr:hypothetical protein [Candidatus Angelobacter sp.]